MHFTLVLFRDTLLPLECMTAKVEDTLLTTVHSFMTFI